MAEDFLSQDEVDALLKGSSGEEEGAVAAEETGGVRKYDLGRQERIVRGRMPTLEFINERFVRYLRGGLFNYMKQSIEISAGQIRIQKYSDFVGNLIVPTNFNLVEFKPLRGTGLIVLDPNLVFLVIDNMFGGDGRFHTRVEGREFTPTEQRIIQGLLRTIFTEYEKAWKSFYELKLGYIRSEISALFINVIKPSDMVVAMTYSLEFSGSTAEMHVCMPYSMIEPIREMLYNTSQGDPLAIDHRWVSMLSSQLQTANIELVANLGETQVTLNQILNMKVGDVIPFEVSETVTVNVEKTPVIECRYGLQNGRYALKIENFVASEQLETSVKR